MAQQTISTLKSWFVRGAKPTQSQFADFIDSFRHKSDNIAISEVTGLQQSLNAASVPIETNFGDVDEDITIPFDRRRLIRINLTDPESVLSINSTNAVLMQEVLMVFEPGNPEPIFGTGFKRVSSAAWSPDSVNYVHLVYLSATEVTYEVLNLTVYAISNSIEIERLINGNLRITFDIVEERNVDHYVLERYDLIDDDLYVVDDEIEAGIGSKSITDASINYGNYNFEYRIKAVFNVWSGGMGDVAAEDEEIDIVGFKSTDPEAVVNNYSVAYDEGSGLVQVEWTVLYEMSVLNYRIQRDSVTINNPDALGAGSFSYPDFVDPGTYTYTLSAVLLGGQVVELYSDSVIVP
jgi:hypothetical protein